MGFTQFSNIYLYDGDIFDCHKKNKKENTCGPSELQNHRVSFFTEHNDFSLFRCGKFTRFNTENFGDRFVLDIWFSTDFYGIN